ncbi:protease modulator HflC [Lysinibacillus endophyticus]|uniref:Protein HflC n=1 Tax=Ureibacillus endophyticus TaxID=1978490 RepID=A0A494ZBD2_9BACL|nr:protease modulator HflC [Lysinibacillus endophyticus]MCP1145547.1 protease modulator HflC [Lysinibacillus endophyticus]RKQ20061.1 protease modulator HflC [Lysinibacillus endophyticus]
MSNNNFDGDLEKFIKSLFASKNKKDKNVVDIKDAKVIKEKNKKPFDGRKFAKSAIVLTALFAVIVIILANIYIVKENEYRVVRQFGEVVKYENEPGINFKVPFIQSVTTLPKNLMTYDMTEEEINTLDKKRIIIDNYAVWRVTDPKALISNAGNLVNAESRMEEYIYSVIRTELGQLNYDDIINDENSSRGSINDKVTERVNELLTDGNFGIEVVDVRIRRTDLPEENEQSVYTRMISERESIAQKYLSEGDAEKNRIEAQTDRKVQELIATAKKEAALIRAEGESEAAKIYNREFSKDPEFYSLYRTLESYKKTIDDDTMIILPSDSPYAKILSGYLE